MAFTYTVSGRTIFGNKRFVWGTFTNTATSTGGDITTGLNRVEAFWTQTKSDGAAATEVGINETFPIATAVTIVTAQYIDGYWFALGI